MKQPFLGGTLAALMFSLAVMAGCADKGAQTSDADSGAEVPEYTLVIKDHLFEPDRLVVPAGQKFKLVVDNQDDSAEEFESDVLHLEKVIPGKTSATLNVGPLQPGEYPFFGEFHEDTTKGVLVVE